MRGTPRWRALGLVLLFLPPAANLTALYVLCKAVPASRPLSKASAQSAPLLVGAWRVLEAAHAPHRASPGPAPEPSGARPGRRTMAASGGGLAVGSTGCGGATSLAQPLIPPHPPLLHRDKGHGEHTVWVSPDCPEPMARSHWCVGRRGGCRVGAGANNRRGWTHLAAPAAAALILPPCLDTRDRK